MVTLKKKNLNEVPGVGPNPVGLVSLKEEEIRTQTHRGKTSEDTGRRRPSANQGGRPQKGPSLQT